MKWYEKLVVLVALVIAVLAILEWEPWSNSGDKTTHHARENIRSTFGWRKGHSYTKTLVYVGGPRWAKVSGFGGLVRKDGKIHLNRARNEKVVVGFAVYGVRGKAKPRKTKKWHGKNDLPLREKAEMKSGKSRMLALIKVTALMYRPGYLRPVAAG